MASRATWVYEFWPGGAAGEPEQFELLGGKGAGLARLCRAGFPVPAGFTITTTCCDYFLRNQHWPDDWAPQVRAALKRLETRAGGMFASGTAPLLLAVRSGAPVSMPGMMDTLLDVGLHPRMLSAETTVPRFWPRYAAYLRRFLSTVGGEQASRRLREILSTRHVPADSDQECQREAEQLLSLWEEMTASPWSDEPWSQLRLAIEGVCRSWHNSRAQAYRKRRNLSECMSTAVTVQVMFPAERAGVLFTVNPHDPLAREMMLEASWGLGESVVGGMVSPDVYYLDAATCRMVRAMAGDRPAGEPALSANQMLDIGEWGRKVEKLFGEPCDIEWGWARGQTVLLQARTIPDWGETLAVAREREAEVRRLRALAGTERVVWVAHNLAETLPLARPLTRDAMKRLLSGKGALGRLYRLLGFNPADDVESIIEWIGSRPYVDPRRLARLFFGDMPLAYDLDRLHVDPMGIEGPPGMLEWERMGPLFFLSVPKFLRTLWRASWRERKLAVNATSRFDQQVVQRLTTFLETCDAIDPRRLSDSLLWNEWCRRRDWVLGEWAAESLLPGYLGGLAFTRLAARLTRILGPARGPELASQLISGLPDDPALRQTLALEQVAYDEMSLASFLTTFGHRAGNEMELAEPRWNEDAASLSSWTHRRRNPSDSLSPRASVRYASQVAAREASEQQLPRELAEHGGASLREWVVEDLQLAKRLLPYREIGKFHWLKGYARLREVAEEWGRRWNLGNDIYFLHEREIETFATLGEDVIADLPNRKKRWERLRLAAFPDVLDSADWQNAAADARSHMPSSDVREGHGARRGKSENGRIRAARTTWDVRPLSAGQAEGVVIHGHHPHDMTSFPVDGVLVCASAEPGWTPWFAESRGVIVERGGALSHGALIARDLGVPMVACEAARQSLPEGTRVRIDGSQGRIEIVEALP